MNRTAAGSITSLFWKAAIRVRHFFSRRQGVQIGQGIPNFALRDLKGRTYVLSYYFPKKAVALWFTNLCSSCRDRIGFLQAAYQSNRERLEVLAISTLGADRGAPERVSQTYKFDFPLLLDPEDWLGTRLGFDHPSGACPMYNLLLLDRRGRLRFKHHLSAVGDEAFLQALSSCAAM